MLKVGFNKINLLTKTKKEFYGIIFKDFF